MICAPIGGRADWRRLGDAAASAMPADRRQTTTNAHARIAPAHPARGLVPVSLRSRGALDLSFRTRAGGTQAHRTAQSGCLRVRLPCPDNAGDAPCAVLINTSGGVAEGDRIEQRVFWDEDSIATVTTQAAEKVYRALDVGSTIVARLNVARGARAEWLPQETILFDKARLHRDTQITLAGDAAFLGLETLVLGRHAMGETVRRGRLRDSTRIWRDGRLVYADTLALDGDIGQRMASAAIGGGAGAMAVLICASTCATAYLDPLRTALAGARGHAAASAWNGLLAVRLIARDGETLRKDIVAALGVLREGRPLPRVWRC